MKSYPYVRRSLLILVCVLYTFVNSCKEDSGITVNRIGEIPGPVSNVQIKPISGGAIITYDLPKSEDLRYIKATYHLDNGIARETKSSIYKNQITVDGFGKEGVYSIQLRSVAVGETSSEPLSIDVEVLRPPHLLVLDRLRNHDEILPTFGGFNVAYENETEANLVIRIIRKNNQGVWEAADNTYTNFREGVIRVRGQEANPTDFGIFVEDRWDHTSDTLHLNLTPMEEIPIPTATWAKSPVQLKGDVGNRGGAFDFAGIWDGNTNKGFLSTGDPNNPNINIYLPNSLTFDLGIPVLLSRMQIWATRYSTPLDIYGPAHLYDFEIFGSNSPNPNGEFDDTWTSLGRFTSERPSGFGFGVPATKEEEEQIKQNGETYEFPDPTGVPKFRYIRFRNYATWAGAYEGGANFFIYELKLFGQL